MLVNYLFDNFHSVLAEANMIVSVLGAMIFFFIYRLQVNIGRAAGKRKRPLTHSQVIRTPTDRADSWTFIPFILVSFLLGIVGFILAIGIYFYGEFND